MTIELLLPAGQTASTNSSTVTARDLIENARRDGVSGRLWMRLHDVDQPVSVYLHHGHVYAAERSTDPGLGVRLLVEGIVTRRQLRAGSLDEAGIDRLGALFDLDPTIDRDAVESFVARITAELLSNVADLEVGSHSFDTSHGHPNEIDQWFGVAAPMIVPVAPAEFVLDDIAAAVITDSVLAAVNRALATQGHAAQRHAAPALAA